MKTFWLGTVIALVIGIVVGVVYTVVDIGTAEHYGTDYVHLRDAVSDEPPVPLRPQPDPAGRVAGGEGVLGGARYRVFLDLRVTRPLGLAAVLGRGGLVFPRHDLGVLRRAGAPFGNRLVLCHRRPRASLWLVNIHLVHAHPWGNGVRQ
jgi:hypothetical protein